MATGALPFGARARELLLELKRSDWLPSYNEEGVRAVIDEVNGLYKQVSRCMPNAADPEVAVAVVLFHTSALRDKRCLLAYLKHRMGKLVRLRWDSGSTIPDALQQLLSAEEQRFFADYDALLSDYMREVDLELTTDQQPPKNLYIEVRALENCGELLTDSGPVNLERNTTHYLRRQDVETLIRQGLVEEL